jgi:hypothetical protein
MARFRIAAMGAVGSGVALVPLVPVSGASADTVAYELYCPGSPVGKLVINDVMTTSPSASPISKSRSRFPPASRARQQLWATPR